MKRYILIIFFISTILLSVFVLFGGINYFSARPDKAKFIFTKLSEDYYFKPVKFISVDDKIGAVSKNSEVSLPLDLVRGKYLGLFFKDKWSINGDIVSGDKNIILASRKSTDGLTTILTQITIVPINIQNNGKNNFSVTVTYWEQK